MAAGRCDEATLGALREIGESAGVAFQISDDILDMTSDEKVFGKKNFGDLYEGKLTLIILRAYAGATAEERERIDGIYRKTRQEKTAEDIEFLKAVIGKYDGIGYARAVAEKHGRMAAEAIERHRGELPDNEYRRILISAAEELYKRDK
jgi:geranylgeranyl pyrophosphate synthase